MEDYDRFFYVSHIVRDELPEQGLQKLYFYTKMGENYYWGLDNNSLSEEDMKEIEKTLQVIRLPNLIEVEKNKNRTLWANSEGKIYIADRKNPYSGDLHTIEAIVLF